MLWPLAHLKVTSSDFRFLFFILLSLPESRSVFIHDGEEFGVLHLCHPPGRALLMLACEGLRPLTGYWPLEPPPYLPERDSSFLVAFLSLSDPATQPHLQQLSEKQMPSWSPMVPTKTSVSWLHFGQRLPDLFHRAIGFSCPPGSLTPLSTSKGRAISAPVRVSWVTAGHQAFLGLLTGPTLNLFVDWFLLSWYLRL